MHLVAGTQNSSNEERHFCEKCQSLSISDRVCQYLRHIRYLWYRALGTKNIRTVFAYCTYCKDYTVNVVHAVSTIHIVHTVHVEHTGPYWSVLYRTLAVGNISNDDDDHNNHDDADANENL